MRAAAPREFIAAKLEMVATLRPDLLGQELEEIDLAHGRAILRGLSNELGVSEAGLVRALREVIKELNRLAVIRVRNVKVINTPSLSLLLAFAEARHARTESPKRAGKLKKVVNKLRAAVKAEAASNLVRSIWRD